MVLLLILAAQLFGCQTSPKVEGRMIVSPERRGLIKKLDSTIIEKFYFSDTPLSKAVDLLMEESRRADLTHEGVRITVRIPNNYVEPEPKVTISLRKDISLRDAIEILTMGISWVYRIEDTEVIILPLHSD